MQPKHTVVPQLALLLIAVVCVALKFWLVQAQSLTFQGYGKHDDMLFVQLAQNIKDTGWFGPYDNLTLAKGPFYSFFLVANSYLGTPLLSVQAALYLFAVIAICAVLRPLIKNDWLLLLLFVLLLFQPASFDAVSNNRTLRTSLSVSLALLTLAGFIKVAASPLRQWEAILLGLFSGTILALFSMTREDTVWLLPALAILLGSKWLVSFLKQQITNPLFTFSTACLCMFSLFILAIKMLNTHFYQVFAITEFQHPAFPYAYGTLLRVKPAQRFKYIPVTASTRQLLYNASPAFQKLKGPMELHFAPGWSENSSELTGFQPTEKQVAGGWWMWALRDAAAASSYYKSGATAASYFYQVGREVNEACDTEKLVCYPPHSSMTPILQWEDFQQIIPGYFQLLANYFSTLHFSPYNEASGGTEYEAQVYSAITHEKLFQNEEQKVAHFDEGTLTQKKLLFLDQLGKTYQLVALPWMSVGLLSVLYLVFKRDRAAYILVGILSSALTLHLIVVIIHYTSFPAFGAIYLSALYPLFLITSFTGVVRAAPYLQKDFQTLSLNKTKAGVMFQKLYNFIRVKPMR